MSASPEFIEYVKELFEPLGKLKEGMFFGGFAFKSGNKQFAMIMGNTLYFCVNDITRKKYEKEDMEPFSYSNKKGIVKVKKYYSAPEDLFENQEKLVEWAKEAIDSAYSYK
ncbi:TfoX/Sxy family protein [sulfur-oxidizing endosymbiont of Gigantopelta aegis]|uniref:TfoX/Sxy family protein n=1 Tax=sulfur-oxidizing endosymbiont of Gigantopelta aegis TaxID=2794934 RepID=UPI0018DD0CFD|nr:TfoX/Sxy family protein [sulfur-oxidizing endosymbiont of Gigantopelta aegis]